jgi:predicted methyltransferase
MKKNPPSVLSYMPSVSKVQQVDQSLTVCIVILNTLKENLVMVQNRMKQQADQGCSEHEFAEGKHVFLRLQTFKQTSLKSKHCYKLTPKIYGPYPILKRVGLVAYRSKFPSDSKLHHVFHVSCLKKVLDTRCQT